MNHDETVTVRPLTLAWVGRHLEAGERIVKAEALHGGITAEMRRLIIGTRDGGTRDLVLRSGGPGRARPVSGARQPSSGVLSHRTLSESHRTLTECSSSHRT